MTVKQAIKELKEDTSVFLLVDSVYHIKHIHSHMFKIENLDNDNVSFLFYYQIAERKNCKMIYTNFVVEDKKGLNEALKAFLHKREVDPKYNITWEGDDIVVSLC